MSVRVKDGKLYYVSTREDRAPAFGNHRSWPCEPAWKVKCWMCGMAILSISLEHLDSICSICKLRYQIMDTTAIMDKLWELEHQERYSE